MSVNFSPEILASIVTQKKLNDVIEMQAMNQNLFLSERIIFMNIE